MPHWPTLYLRDDEYDHVDSQTDGEDTESFNGYIRSLVQADMEEGE